MAESRLRYYARQFGRRARPGADLRGVAGVPSAQQ